jgi:FkbM family methyltransferase
VNINRFGGVLQINTLASHTFLPHLFGDDGVVVLDLGANTGNFYREFSSRFPCKRYVAIEPNARLTDWAVRAEGVELRNYAVALSDGPVTLYIADNPEASRIAQTDKQAIIADPVEQVTVKGKALSTIITELGINEVDVLKMDIEGVEVDLLLTLPEETLRTIGQVTLEFHDFCGISTPEQVHRAISRLQQAGFYGIQFSCNNTNWCFVRSDHPRLRRLKYFTAKHVASRMRRAKHRLQHLRNRDVI